MDWIAYTYSELAAVFRISHIKPPTDSLFDFWHLILKAICVKITTAGQEIQSFCCRTDSKNYRIRLCLLILLHFYILSRKEHQSE